MKTIRAMPVGVAAGLTMTALLGARPASAQLYMDFHSGSISGADSRNFSLGYAFSVNSPTPVNRLGVFDVGGDGLDISYPVAIWDPANPSTPIVQGSVGVGLSGLPLPSLSGIGLWRATAVPLTLLSPGVNYIIATFRPGNADHFGFGIPITGVNYRMGRYSEGPSFVMPTREGTDMGYFGPTFGFNSQIAPEPASLVLLALGAFGFLARRRR